MNFALLSSFILAGCIKEDLSDCHHIPTIEVRTVIPAGAANSGIQSVTLYVFDREGRFAGSHTAGLNEVVPLNYPGEGSLQVVAVANQSADNETVSSFISKELIATGVITLKQFRDYFSMPTYVPLSDLFWGIAGMANERRAAEHVILDISRITASVNIKIRGLKEYAAATDEDFTAVVGAAYDTVDFLGIPTGAGTNFLPQGGVFSTVGSYSQLEIPTFNIFSSAAGSDIIVRIYHNGTLIDTVTTDNQGNPLTTYNGRLLEVRISYVGGVTVTVINANWGEKLVWKDFN